MHKNTDEIFILTKRTGYIPHLKTYGPIPNPIKCPISLCMSMIIAGVELYELDPVSKLTTKLTLDNLMKDDKFDTVKEEVSNESEDQVVVAPITALAGSVAEVKKEKEEDPDPAGESTPPSDDEVDDEAEDEDPAEDDEVDGTPEEAKEPENPEAVTPVEPNKPATTKKTGKKKK